MDAEAATGSKAGVQLAAEERDPFAHADEAVSPSVAVGGAVAIVGDLNLERLGAVADGHGRAGFACMLAGVGQRLLNDPVGR